MLRTTSLLLVLAAACSGPGNDPKGDWSGDDGAGHQMKASFSEDSTVGLFVPSPADTTWPDKPAAIGRWRLATGRLVDTGMPYDYVSITLQGPDTKVLNWAIVNGQLFTQPDAARLTATELASARLALVRGDNFVPNPLAAPADQAPFHPDTSAQ